MYVKNHGSLYHNTKDCGSKGSTLHQAKKIAITVRRAPLYYVGEGGRREGWNVVMRPKEMTFVFRSNAKIPRTRACLVSEKRLKVDLEVKARLVRREKDAGPACIMNIS